MATAPQCLDDSDEEENHLQYEVDDIVEVTPLDSVLGCPSNHSNYTPVNVFDISDLPDKIKCQEIMDLLELNIELTVHVWLKRRQMEAGLPSENVISANHNIDLHGSGSICYFSDTHDIFTCHHGDLNSCLRCHIPDCPYVDTLGKDHFLVTSRYLPMTSDQLKKAHVAFRVSTNQHVVASSEVARNATVELFYHSEDKKNVVSARVVSLCETWKEQDKVHLVCVTDINKKVVNLLQSMSSKMRQLYACVPDNVRDTFTDKYVVVISHPHGTPKVISVGEKDKSCCKKCKNGTQYIETSYFVETCRGCSGAPVIGPGWENGGPVYRVHVGFKENERKIGISKSHWIVDSDPRGGVCPAGNDVVSYSGGVWSCAVKKCQCALNQASGIFFNSDKDSKCETCQIC